MKKKDPEIVRLEAEQKKRELEALMAEIRAKTENVPASVINGSHNLSVAFKEAAQKGCSILKRRRPSLKAARECASELARFA